MGLDLNKVEKRIEDLLARAGHEATPEEEARTSAVQAARLLRRNNSSGNHDLHVIDVKEYDAAWQKELDKVKSGSQGGEELIRQELKLKSAYERVAAARREVDELKKRVDECKRHVNELQVRPGPEIAHKLQVAEQALSQAKEAESQARRAEAQAKKAEVETREACTNLVNKLKSEGSSSTSGPEFVKLHKQVEELTFKVSVAQATARACEGVREEERKHYERGRPPAPSHFFPGFLVGGIMTVMGAVVLRKLATPEPRSGRP